MFVQIHIVDVVFVALIITRKRKKGNNPFSFFFAFLYGIEGTDYLLFTITCILVQTLLFIMNDNKDSRKEFYFDILHIITVIWLLFEQITTLTTHSYDIFLTLYESICGRPISLNYERTKFAYMQIIQICISLEYSFHITLRFESVLS